MISIQSHFVKIFGSLVVGTIVVSGVSTSVSSSLPLLAQNPNPSEVLPELEPTENLENSPTVDSKIPSRWEPQVYQPPEGISYSGGAEAIGIRGASPEELPISIVPITSNGFGTTVAAYPTFLIYLPNNLSESLRSATFVLVDPNDESNEIELYKASFFQPKVDSGFVQITLPSQIGLPPLEIGKNYLWQFEVHLGTEHLETQRAQGWIRRVELSSELKAQLQQAESQEQAQLYAQAEIWYDAAAILAQLYQTSPQNHSIAEDWKDLLESAGFEQIAQSLQSNFNAEFSP